MAFLQGESQYFLCEGEPDVVSPIAQDYASNNVKFQGTLKLKHKRQRLADSAHHSAGPLHNETAGPTRSQASHATLSYHDAFQTVVSATSSAGSALQRMWKKVAKRTYASGEISALARAEAEVGFPFAFGTAYQSNSVVGTYAA